MLDVALLSSRPNLPFLLLNCTEAVPSRHIHVYYSLQTVDAVCEAAYDGLRGDNL
jgi:hypothetical protein